MRNRGPENKPRRSVFRRALSIVLKIFLTIIIILVIVVILVQTPYVQNIIRGKAEKYLSRKLHTRVNIGGLYVGWPRTVVLKAVYLEDLKKDTLLSLGHLGVDIGLWGLLQNKLDIGSIQVEELTVKVHRLLPDTVYNFQFIADAFASKEDKPKDTTASTPMKISLGPVTLKRIRLVYKDVVSGDDAEVWVGDSRIKMEGFDPTQPLQGRSGQVVLEKSRIEYHNTVNAFNTSLQLGALLANIESFDLSQKDIRLKDLRLDSTTSAIRLGKTLAVKGAGASGKAAAVKGAGPKAAVTAGAVSPVADTAAGNWRFTLAALQFNGDNFQFDNDNQKPQRTGMDYAHLNISGLTLHATQILYNKDSIAALLSKGEFKERSGFELDQLKGDVLYTNKLVRLQGLDLRTPGTHLRRSLSMSYKDLANSMKDPAHTGIDIDLPDSKIQVKDILVFVPSLRSQPIFSRPSEVWQLNARAKGSLDQLRVETLQFSGPQDLKVDLSGTLLHPTDPDKVKADLFIRHLSGSQKGLAALLPAGTLPASIQLPARYDLQGKMNGGMEDMQADLTLITSSGRIQFKGFIRRFRDSRNASYDLFIQAKGLDLGYILRDRETWGLLTADLKAKGKGFDPKYANATANAKLYSAAFRQYEYKDLLLDCAIAGQRAELSSSIQNMAIRYNLKASADLHNKYPGIQLDWQIDTADLRALHLVKDTLQLHGHIGADFADTNPDSLQGKLKIADLVVVSGLRRLATDSILLVAAQENGREEIRFNSEMADLDWKGRYKPTEVVRALEQTINRYYRIDGYKDSAFTPQDWVLTGNLRTSPLVLSFVPSLKGTDSIGIRASFNSETHDLHFAAKAPLVHLGSQTLQSTAMLLGTDNDQLRYSIETAGMAGAPGSSLVLHRTSLKGWLANDQLFTSLLLEDGKGKNRYHLAGQLNKGDSGWKFQLNPDSLLLNYDKWLVSRDNYFQYDSAGLVINDFAISNKDQSLKVSSDPPAASSPVKVAFANFRVGTLTRFINQDSLLADGVINGKAEVKNILSAPVFTSDLQIRDLTYKSDTVGTLSLKVSNEKANAFTADISLEGNKNDVRVTGDYYTGEGRMDMKLDLKNLNLAAMTPFVKTQVQDMRGFLRGQLAVTGTLDKPALNGNLHFDSARITPVITGEPLTLSKDNIEFDVDGFNFSQFSLVDSAGNKAIIDGNVFTEEYRDFNVDVSLNADNFRLVNAPQSNGRMFYGKMNLDAAINLSGDPMDDLKADGDLRVNKSTDFTLVLPSSDPEVVDRMGVVRFIDKDHPGDTLKGQLPALMASRQSDVKGMDIALNIETDSSAMFTMIVDERNGDALSVRGRSNLVFGMDKSGKTDLTGGFEVESGSYNLSLSVLKRKFEIQRGSTITWTGDPRTATIDITANYTANTPSIDLIENELSGRTPTEITKFKQKLPFVVTLKMEGDLLKPKITFDISLPTNVLSLWPDVDQKLQQIRTQESEMDKQVFALLLLNRFVGEDPLQSAAGGGTSLNSLAFQSASQILTNQLDHLAASLIKGVDIHFDLNNQQDYTSGQERDYTELNVTVSKRLFNDRIQVSVGSNFDVQGTGNPNQQASNIAGDVAVDYRLTKDGRYMVRAYRKNQYEAVVEGQVVETGVSFILTFDYNKLREIFAHSRNDEKLEERKTIKPTGGAHSNR